jgi:hypothetical protein
MHAPEGRRTTTHSSDLRRARRLQSPRGMRPSSRALLSLLLSTFAATTAACDTSDAPDTVVFDCGPKGECPEGSTCAVDFVCRPDGRDAKKTPAPRR